MSAIKDGRYPIMLDKERHLLFSLNIIDEIQDKFGAIEDLGEYMQGKDGIKNVKWLLTQLLNEGADESDEPLTEKQVGRLIHAGNLVEVQNEMMKSFTFGSTGTTETNLNDTDEVDTKNVTSEQV